MTNQMIAKILFFTAASKEGAFFRARFMPRDALHWVQVIVNQHIEAQ